MEINLEEDNIDFEFIEECQGGIDLHSHHDAVIFLVDA